MYFPEEGIDLFAGRQKLDGDKALQYVRWRGDPSADIGRVARQQKFVKAFLDQAISLGTVAKLPSLMGELRDNVKTDMTTPKMLNLAFRFTDIKSLSFSSATLPGEAKTIGGGAYWVMDEEAARELLLSIYAPPEPEAEAGEDADGNAGEDTDNDDAGEAGATADGADGEAA
jgi:anionic cell wall polymer biosynthesis LytR-Cps2A-Psr (LCP) family protein